MSKKKTPKIKKSFTEQELQEIFYSPEFKTEPYVFVPSFAMALASQPVLHKKIAELYEKKPFEHHLAFKKSNFKHFYRLNSLNLKGEFYAKRLIALFEYDLQTKDGFNTYQLFSFVKNIYHPQTKLIEECELFNEEFLAYELYPLALTNNFLQHNMISVVEDVRTFFSKKHSYYSFMLDERLIYDLTMIFLCKCLGKPIPKKENFEAIKKVFLVEIGDEDLTRVYLEKLLEKKAEKDKESFYQNVKNITAANINKNFVSKIDSAFGYKDVILLKNSELDFYSFFELVRYVEILENYMLPIVQLPKNKKEAEKEIAQILAICPFGEEDELERYYFVYTGLFLKRIIQEFKETKSFFYKQETNEHALEVKILKEELKEQKEKNKLLEQKLKEQEKLLNNIQKKEQAKWNSLHQENKALSQKIESYEKEIKHLEEELHYFREYSYSLEKRRENVIKEKTFDEIEQFLNILKEKKIILIGGHPKWKSKMKEILSSLIFMDKDTRFDASLLQTADFVYYQTDNLSHGVFYRTHPIIKKANVPFGFISAANIDITLKEMKDEWDKMYNRDRG